MSKNIGILTFHYANNYGAVLQAYALRKTINSFPDCNAEIINYVPKGYIYPIFTERNLVNEEREKREKFQRFLFEHCGIKTPIIYSVIGNQYDIYIVGSDQIWNTDIKEVVADYEYFLPHLDDEAKKIAYSASIGMEQTKVDKELFKKYLSKFKRISLREKNYIDIISRLYGKKCEYTLDPTMLLNISDYEALEEKPVNVEEEYILYFWYGIADGALESVELVNTLSRKYNLSIKHTLMEKKSLARQLLREKNNYIMQCGIGEFLWYIQNAKIIVTNSFHGAVFSIIFKKPLYIYYPLRGKSRQDSLVELFNLQDRVIKGYMSSDKLNLEIDYTSVYEILEQERKKSISYLENAIKEV